MNSNARENTGKRRFICLASVAIVSLTVKGDMEKD
jgi:hypothetical protein